MKEPLHIIQDWNNGYVYTFLIKKEPEIHTDSVIALNKFKSDDTCQDLLKIKMTEE